VIAQKAFKYRFFPTDEQAAQLAKTFGCALYVYNHALVYRTTAWQQKKQSVGYHLARISDGRRDRIQKFTTKIIRENQAIFVEGLNVAGMLKNGNLAKHIADAAFAELNILRAGQ
jgi:transposase